MTMREPLLLLLLGSMLGCASAGVGREEAAAFQARKQLTRELVNRGEWQTAFAYTDEMHRQRSDDPEVLVLRGIIYRERNLPAEAEAHHKRAVALDGKNPGYLNNLGFSLLIRRKNKEALETLQRAARLAPTNRRVRTNVGFAFAAVGDFPRAAREFEMGAGPAEAKNNLGFAYEKRGDLQNAFELYVAALRLDPDCERARGNLSHLARRLGKPVPADIEVKTSSKAPEETP